MITTRSAEWQTDNGEEESVYPASAIYGSHVWDDGEEPVSHSLHFFANRYHLNLNLAPNQDGHLCDRNAQS